MENIIKFYQEWLGFDKFYQTILANRKNYPNEYNQNIRLLDGVSYNSSNNITELSTDTNDLRIDVPVWFGNIHASNTRVVVLGLEPRDTNQQFNIERVNNLVFGTPFGIERWNENSSIIRKPQNKYYRVFNPLTVDKNVFLIFSDVVKHYKVVEKNNINRVNDNYARDNFFKHAHESRQKLLEEINLINPTHIVTLGNESNTVIKSILPEHLTKIIGIRHPANGGEKIAQEQISKLIKSLSV